MWTSWTTAVRLCEGGHHGKGRVGKGKLWNWCADSIKPEDTRISKITQSCGGASIPLPIRDENL